ncbi:MAG: DUF3047 domain-containing protein [Balneolaceae bacterium]|nr:DUF3047 domain-containing protein [Balneolaceae bacterium]
MKISSTKVSAIILTCLFLTANLGVAQDVDVDLPPLEKTDQGALLIDDFEDGPIGGLPCGWYNRDGKRKANHPEERELFEYEIQQQGGNKYLHYAHTDARHLNFPLVGRPGLNIYEYPTLSWKWRVERLPEGADESSSDYNDAAASIYVVFGFGRIALVKKVPKSIRYTWSSTLEEGTVVSKLFGNQKIVVLESGPENTGEWMTFRRNIVEDYRRLFGDDPPETPIAILIMSDGDSTSSPAIADYDDIKLLPAQ